MKFVGIYILSCFIYFLQAQDLQLRFASKPQINTNNSIGACSYYSTTNRNKYVYLLLNDTIRINLTSSDFLVSTPSTSTTFSTDTGALPNTSSPLSTPSPPSPSSPGDTTSPPSTSLTGDTPSPPSTSSPGDTPSPPSTSSPGDTPSPPGTLLPPPDTLTTQLTPATPITPDLPLTPPSSFSPRPQRRKRRDVNGNTSNILNGTEILFTTGPYQIKSYNEQGYFQCVIFDANRMSSEVKSERSNFVRLADPMFTSDESNSEVLAAGSIRFPGCLFESPVKLPANATYWLKNGSERLVVYSDPQLSNVNMYKFNDLVLSSVNLTAGGFYQCGITVLGRQILSKKKFLTVQEITVVDTRSPRVVSNGASRFITGCKFELRRIRSSRLDELKINGYWLFNDTIRINVENITRSRNELEFPNLNRSYYTQIGSYQCAVFIQDFTKLPTFSRKVNLSSFADPVFLSTPDTITVTAGLSLLITGCRFQSEVFYHPRDMYLLKNNTEKIFVGGNATLSNESQYEFPKVLIAKARFSDDNFYQCAIHARGHMTTAVLSEPFRIKVESIAVNFIGAPLINRNLNTNMVHLRCSFSAPQNVVFTGYWLMDNKTRTDTTITYNTTSETYEFERLILNSYAQAGRYQCIVFNQTLMRSLQNSSSSSVIFRDPVFSNETMYDVTVGNSIILKGLSFTSEVIVSQENVYWAKEVFQERKRLNTTTSLYRNNTHLFTFGDLKLLRVNFSDSGSYFCVIDADVMPAPVFSNRIFLAVLDLQFNFTQNLTQSRSLYNGILEISGCTIEIKDGPYGGKLESYWLLNDSPILRTREVHQMIPGQKIYSKKPLTLQYANETGLFSCGFRSRRIVKSQSLELRSVREPKLVSQPQNPDLLTPGAPLTIKGCVFDSVVPLVEGSVYWQKNDKIVIKSSILELNKSENNFKMEDLYIPQVNSSHEGEYQCVLSVDWSDGQIKSSKVVVDIQVETKFIRKPKLTITDKMVTITGCEYQAKTNLRTSSYWLFNNKFKVNTSNSVQPFSNGSNVAKDNEYWHAFQEIRIVHIRDVGSYRCVIGYNGTNITSEEVKITRIPAPIYSEGPVTRRETWKIGDAVEIVGCKFKSAVQLENSSIYWLKDGFERIEAFVKDINPFIQVITTQQGSYQHSSLVFRNSNYTLQGYYQCVIDVPKYLNKQVISEKVNIQFQDISDTRLTVRIDETFNDALLVPTSPEYIELKAKIEKQVEESLKDRDTDAGINRFVEVLRFTEGSINVETRIIYTNVTDAERLLNCKQLPALFTRDKFSGLKVQSVRVNNLDCCHESRAGEESFKGEYNFNDTLVLRTVTDKCRYRSSGQTTHRQCVPDLQKGPQWSQVNLTECLPKNETTQKLLELSNVVVCGVNISANCLSANNVSASLAATVQDGSYITTQQDVAFATDIISSVVKNIDTNTTIVPEDVIENIVNTTNNLIRADIQIIAKAQLNSQSSTNLLRSLDNLAQKIGTILKKSNATSHKSSRSNMALAVAYLPKANLSISSTQTLSNMQRVVIAEDTLHRGTKSRKILSELGIPEEAFQTEKAVIYSYVFKNNVLFIPQTLLKQNKFQPDAHLRRIVQSNVLSATVADTNVANLSTPVMLRFKKIRSLEEEGQNTCEFWNFELGKWSDDGCKKTNELATGHVVCTCDHLTNFALLLDVSQSGNNPLELQIVTWIGCGISLAGLVLTILTYLLFQSLRKKLAPKILICLCVSLATLLILFLSAVEASTNRSSCQAVAALLQYFILTTFCWMSVEGANLYRCFVKVFKSGGDTVFMVKASIYAWGVPLVIVAITAGVAPHNLGNDTFCVVRRHSFYYGVLSPVAIILLANFVALVLVMRGLSKGSMAKSNKSAQDTLKQARIAFMCSVLLGLTWVFALLAVGKATTFFQWLFCIFNSLQGFFIFVFYTVRNKEVQREWMKCFGLDGQNNEASSTGNRPAKLRKRSKKSRTMSTGNGLYNVSYDNVELTAFDSGHG